MVVPVVLAAWVPMAVLVAMEEPVALVVTAVTVVQVVRGTLA